MWPQVYNIYDNCPRNREFMEKTGLTPYQLNEALRGGMNSGGVAPELSLSAILGEDLTAPEPDGGYPWSCGGEGAIKGYLSQPAVMKALVSGPHGITLYL